MRVILHKVDIDRDFNKIANYMKNFKEISVSYYDQEGVIKIDLKNMAKRDKIDTIKTDLKNILGSSLFRMEE